MAVKGRTWAWLPLALAIAACERDPEATRALLKQQQQQWQRDIATLRQRETDLRSRLARVSAARPAVAGELPPERVRVEPLLNGTRQSLSTVAIQAEQASVRLDPLLRQGGEAAGQAVDAEGSRITGYVRMMREQLDTADRELAALER